METIPESLHEAYELAAIKAGWLLAKGEPGNDFARLAAGIVDQQQQQLDDPEQLADEIDRVLDREQNAPPKKRKRAKSNQ